MTFWHANIKSFNYYPCVFGVVCHTTSWIRGSRAEVRVFGEDQWLSEPQLHAIIETDLLHITMQQIAMKSHLLYNEWRPHRRDSALLWLENALYIIHNFRLNSTAPREMCTLINRNRNSTIWHATYGYVNSVGHIRRQKTHQKDWINPYTT